MAIPSWVQGLISAFPNLASEGFEIIDEPSEQYNCIAYATGYTDRRWDPNGRDYWPSWATETARIESLIEVFTGLGYERCDDSHFGDGYQKVALYEIQGAAKHVAIQMPNGLWRSKMGKGPVIEHRSPESLSGGMYGEATVFMRRPLGA